MRNPSDTSTLYNSYYKITVCISVRELSRSEKERQRQGRKKEKEREREREREKSASIGHLARPGIHAWRSHHTGAKTSSKRITFYWMSLDHGWHPTVNSVARTCQPPPLITYTDLFTRTGLKPSHEQNRAYITEYITDQTNEKRARNGAVRTRRPPRQDWGLLPGRGSCHGNPTTPETHDRLFSLFPRLSAIIPSLSNPLYLSLHTLAPLSSSNHRAFTPASLSVLRCCPPRAYDFSLYSSISLLSSSPRTMFLSLSLSLEQRAELASRKLRSLPEEKSQKLVASRRISAFKDDIPCLSLCRTVRASARAWTLYRAILMTLAIGGDLLPMTRYGFLTILLYIHCIVT